ncbi:MAG TPA: hypothetical protein VM490_15540 [Armatimonadaceae bacterium]|jgi:hypothetical protein|nr:hypothetical protein [Armatimonadaceae bacterium]
MADEIRDERIVRDDNIQHGIDDDPNADAEKGAAIGGIGGMVVGGIAGAALGPAGAIAGAIIGGAAGAAASGAAVAAIDNVDNDNTVSGVGSGATGDLTDDEDSVYVDRVYPTTGTPLGGGIASTNQPGIQTGGYTVAGTPDTRGIMEKTADAVTGDNLDDKQGVPVAGSTPGYRDTTYVGNDPDGTIGINRREELGESAPSIKTGGYTTAGTPDTRGIMEKTADAITGDPYDDKQGVPVAGSSAAGYSNTAYNVDDPDGTVGMNRREELGETVPSIKTGGYANDGTPDTRGLGEKAADAVTGDDIDDKTGKRVNHP